MTDNPVQSWEWTWWARCHDCPPVALWWFTGCATPGVGDEALDKLWAWWQQHKIEAGHERVTIDVHRDRSRPPWSLIAAPVVNGYVSPELLGRIIRPSGTRPDPLAPLPFVAGDEDGMVSTVGLAYVGSPERW